MRSKPRKAMTSGFTSPQYSFHVTGQQGQIPTVGFGTASLHGDVCIEAVTNALNAGYRMIDTALLYGNQVEVGEAILKSSIPREEIWITSKVGFFPSDSDNLWMLNKNNLKGREEASIDLCLQKLGVDQIDLCLLHNPTTSAVEYNAATLPHHFELGNHSGGKSALSMKFPDGEILRPILMKHKQDRVKLECDLARALAIRKESWKTLELAQRAGKCKYIGVSNYPANMLLEMMNYAEVMPAVNELEFHPMFASPDLRSVAMELGVVLIGYGIGLACTLYKHPEIELIASKMSKAYIQIVERWMLQNNVIPIPRSKSRDHITENLAIFDFELSASDMTIIDSLNQDYPYYWDPVSSALTVSTS